MAPESPWILLLAANSVNRGCVSHWFCSWYKWSGISQEYPSLIHPQQCSSTRVPPTASHYRPVSFVEEKRKPGGRSWSSTILGKAGEPKWDGQSHSHENYGGKVVVKSSLSTCIHVREFLAISPSYSTLLHWQETGTSTKEDLTRQSWVLEFPRYSARDEQLGNEPRKNQEEILPYFGFWGSIFKEILVPGQTHRTTKDSGILIHLATQVRTKINASIKAVLWVSSYWELAIARWNNSLCCLTWKDEFKYVQIPGVTLRVSCAGLGPGLHDPCGSLPTHHILWFCEIQSGDYLQK